jgi:CHASE3 domain sensor protein
MSKATDRRASMKSRILAAEQDLKRFEKACSEQLQTIAHLRSLTTDKEQLAVIDESADAIKQVRKAFIQRTAEEIAEMRKAVVNIEWMEAQLLALKFARRPGAVMGQA